MVAQSAGDRNALGVFGATDAHATFDGTGEHDNKRALKSAIFASHDDSDSNDAPVNCRHEMLIKEISVLVVVDVTLVVTVVVADDVIVVVCVVSQRKSNDWKVFSASFIISIVGKFVRVVSSETVRIPTGSQVNELLARIPSVSKSLTTTLRTRATCAQAICVCVRKKVAELTSTQDKVPSTPVVASIISLIRF